jgi:hypothetical protein
MKGGTVLWDSRNRIFVPGNTMDYSDYEAQAANLIYRFLESKGTHLKPDELENIWGYINFNKSNIMEKISAPENSRLRTELIRLLTRATESRVAVDASKGKYATGTALDTNERHTMFTGYQLDFLAQLNGKYETDKQAMADYDTSRFDVREDELKRQLNKTTLMFKSEPTAENNRNYQIALENLRRHKADKSGGPASRSAQAFGPASGSAQAFSPASGSAQARGPASFGLASGPAQARGPASESKSRLDLKRMLDAVNEQLSKLQPVRIGNPGFDYFRSENKRLFDEKKRIENLLKGGTKKLSKRKTKKISKRKTKKLY